MAELFLGGRRFPVGLERAANDGQASLTFESFEFSEGRRLLHPLDDVGRGSRRLSCRRCECLDGRCLSLGDRGAATFGELGELRLDLLDVEVLLIGEGPAEEAAFLRVGNACLGEELLTAESCEFGSVIPFESRRWLG